MLSIVAANEGGIWVGVSRRRSYNMTHARLTSETTFGWPANVNYLDLQTTSAQAVCLSIASLSDASTQVWPAAQPIQEIADPRFVGTRFQDSALVNPRLAQRALHVATQVSANARGWGGKKVRDAQTWGMPEAQLLSLRAMLLLCRSRGVSSAHVVDRWINVMEPGDFSKPHCHYEADAAVVYFLDTGTENASAEGNFELIDSRVPFCCPSRPERPTRGIMPAMASGTMLLFPAEWLHHVTPYYGQRPRLTIAWNISVGPRPTTLADPTQQLPGIVGEYQSGPAKPA